MAISYKLVACLLFLICLGGHLDLCLSIQASYYPKVSSWNISSTMFMPLPFGHLASKSGHLAIFAVCKSNHLASHLFPIDWTSSISCSCRAVPGGVKTLWKKGGIASDRSNGRLFWPSLWVQSRGYRVNKEDERGQCCGVWPVGLWHQCVWKKAEIPGQGFREEHLECCYVWVWVRWGIFQGEGIPLQPWQLSARSCKYWAHSIGKVITMKVIALLVFSFCCGGHLVQHIYLGLSLYILTSIFGISLWLPCLSHLQVELFVGGQ